MPSHLTFHASASGKQTLDDAESGGNPFAAALIEILGQSQLMLPEFAASLHRGTVTRSRGFQLPEVPLRIVPRSLCSAVDSRFLPLMGQVRYEVRRASWRRRRTCGNGFVRTTVLKPRRWSAARRKCAAPMCHPGCPQEPGTVPAGSFSMQAAISPGWVSQISSR
jgi:hypothetical protein